MDDPSDERRRAAHRFAHVAPPAHAVECQPWVWFRDAWRRTFTVREWQIGDILISVSGEQTHLGDVTHWMYVGGEDHFDPGDWKSAKRALDDASELLSILDRQHRYQAAKACTSPTPRRNIHRS